MNEMKRQITVSLMIAAAAVSLLLPRSTVTAQVQDKAAAAALKAAIDKETLEGDPKSAIEQYKKIAQDGDPAIAANALFRMAGAYAKLGDTDAAQKTYLRIVAEYAGQKKLAAQAQAQLKVLSSAIFVVDISADGLVHGPAVNLMQSSSFSYWAPVWSPDGQTILAKRARGAAPQDLHDRRRHRDQSSAEESVLRSLITEELRILGHGTSPRPNPWFHDSKGWLGIRRPGCEFCVNRVKAELGLESDLIATLNFPTWPEMMALSPDDKVLYVFARPFQGTAKNDTLVSIDVSSGMETRRIKLPVADDIEEFALSSDGRTIAGWTVSDVKTGESRLFRVGIDGTGFREIFRGRGHSVTWTPDGRTIFFAKSSGGDEWNVIRVPVDGSKEQFTGLRVKGLQYISLSPDGKRLAFDGAAPASPTSGR